MKNIKSINQIMDIIYCSSLAPSGHNTQPWKFEVKDNVILLFPDYTRKLNIVDSDDHALFISLGCALENLIIAANYFGYSASVEYFPKDEEEECIRITLTNAKVVYDDNLFNAISNRQTTRSKFANTKIPLEDLKKLEQVSNQDSVSLVVFKEEKEIDPILEFVKEANKLQFQNKLFINELISWIRFNRKEAFARLDGLNPKSLWFPFIPKWLGKLFLNVFATPNSEAKKSETLIRGSSALLLFVAQTDCKEAWVKLGQSFERVVLRATSLNIKHAHVNIPCEETSVRQKMKNHLGFDVEQPLILIRIGYADLMPKSFRRPISEVIVDNMVKNEKR